VEGYKLLVNGHLEDVPKETELAVRRDGKVLQVTLESKILPLVSQIALVHSDPLAQIGVKLVRPHAEERIYEGNLNLYVDFGRVMCINLVDQEVYIAGVALAEVGARAKPELYKAQALLIRTYLMSNRSKHLEEGFNLCDQFGIRPFFYRTVRCK